MNNEDYFSTRECWDADPLVRGTGDGTPGCLVVLIVFVIGCVIAKLMLI